MYITELHTEWCTSGLSGVLVAYWLKCLSAVESLQVQSPSGASFLPSEGILSSTLKMRRCLSLCPLDVKPLATCATCIPASSLATFNNNACR